MSALRLRLLFPSQQTKDVPLTQLLVVPAERGVTYSIIDAATQKPASGIVLKKKGDALIVEVDEQALVEIEHFYADDQGAAFDVGPAASGEAQLITANDRASQVSSVVWPAGDNDLAAMPLEAEADSNGAMLWGGGLLGGGGLLAAAGGGGGGGGAAVAAVNNIVSGAIVGGPVIDGHGLSVNLYKADGTLLGTATVDAGGRYSYSVGAYTGVVIAEVVDGNDGDDYLDETTNLGKDLNAELFSAGVLTTPNSTLQLNLNVLTSAAYHKAVEAAGGSPLDAATVSNTNTAIAQAFGLPDLHSIVVVTTNGSTTYDLNDGVSAGEVYGTLLAALSGADALRGGDSQASLDALLAGISLTGSTATLNAAAQELVISGAYRANANAQAETSLVVDTIAPVFTSGAVATAINENSGAGQVVYTAQAADASRLSYSLKPGTGDVSAFSIDASSGAVALVGNPNFESKSAYSFTVVATDAAGNASEQAVSLGINDLDEVAPVAPSIDVVATDDIINAAEQGAVISGSAEANATVSLNIAGNLRTVSANGSGAWSYSLVAADIVAMGQGAETLSVTATDAAGNVSAAGTRNVSVDTAAPNAPSINAVATDDIINAAEQAAVISGSAEANATVSLSIAGNLRTVSANGSGVWSYSLVPADIAAMGQGAETLSVTATDAAGNVSAAGTRNVSVDTAAPNAPSINAVATDDIINAAEQAAVISGSAEANATVSLNIAGNLRTVSANGSGAWSYSLVAADIVAMGQGAETLSVTATDAAGNVSAAGTRNVSVDTAAPNAPSIDVVATDDIINAAEQGAVISGSAEANATVSLNIAGNLRTVSANGSGAWSYSLVAADIVAMGQGAETLSVTATDAAGNVSAAGTRNVSVDTAAPNAPSIDAVATDDIINAAEQGAVISGSAEANATVSLSVAGNLRTVSANGSGVWSYSLVPADIAAMGQGAETLSVTATDAAGNISEADTRNVSVDTAAPNAPSINAVATDDIINAAEQGAVISGSAEANATVSLNIAGNLRTVSANGSGAWSYSLVAADIVAMGQGAETLSVTATDAAGNVSAAGTRNVSVDTAAPNAPSIDAVATDDIINAAEQGAVISGSAEANATVSLSVAGNLRTVSANGSGVWSYSLVPADIAAMGQGAETLSVTATDAAGNISEADTRNVSVDTAAPNAPSINAVATDDIINAAEQAAVISGSAEANATVSLSIAGNLRTVSANGSGAWSYSLVAADIVAMGQGAETLSVTATDAAGNVSAAGTRNVSVDTAAPNAPSIDVVATDDIINAAEQGAVISGSAEANATVSLSVAGNLRTVSANGSGVWSYSLVPADIAAMGQGAETLSVTATDAAGNISEADTRNVSVDTAAPNAPSINAVATDDIINAAEQAAVISGSAEANATVSLSIAGNLRTVSANGSGVWSYSLVPADIVAMGQGAETLSVTATDAAGNVSAAGTRAINVDTIAPTAASFALNADTGSSNSDWVTNAGTINVSLAADAASWEFSSNGGAFWAVGTGTSFVLAQGSYGIGSVQVRQTDLAGNVSTVTSNASAITVDSVAPVFLSGYALDTAFGGGDGLVFVDVGGSDGSYPGTTIHLADGGKYILTGAAQLSGSSSYRFAAMRFNADGSLDTSYGSGTGVVTSALSSTHYFSGESALDSSGNIYMPAEVSGGGSDFYDMIVAKFTASGTLDTGFNGDGYALWDFGSSYKHESGQGAAVDANGKLVVVGYSTQDTGVETAVARYNADGTFDTSFATVGWQLYPVAASFDTAKDVVIQSDGKILITGYENSSGSYNAYLMRLSSDGQLDAGFGTGGIVKQDINPSGTDDIFDTAIDASGRIYVLTGGSYAMNVARFTSAGTLDTTFGGGDGIATVSTGGSMTNRGGGMAFDSSGKVLISSAAYLGSGFDTVIARLTSDGALDTSFGQSGLIKANLSDSASGWDEGYDLVVDSADNILIGGYARRSDSNTNDFMVARYKDYQPIALANDTGARGDGVSSDGRVVITGLEAGATWTYSIDGGSSWHEGTGSGFDLTDGTYAIGALQVRQTDLAGNVSAIASNVGVMTVDTVAPTLTASTPADNVTAVAVGSNIVLTFSEAVQAGSGNIVISDGAGDTRNIAISDTSQVTISGSQVTINPTADLASGRTYDVTLASGVLTDTAGNAFAGVATDALDFTTVNTSIVVFDLVEGVSSDHSNRTFDANTAYTIYIRVHSTQSALSTDGVGPGPADTWGAWKGAEALGANDRIVLVGNGSSVKGNWYSNVSAFQTMANLAVWKTNPFSQTSRAARLYDHGDFRRSYNHVSKAIDLWSGNWAANPNQGSALGNVYQVAMPNGILTSQGLA
ncbi:Ig-like domain-containing protein [Pseudomonas benzenivorans]|uniref:Ig-like domain-containing protein n=1 Tax=Pseudomonas benzenivorans TaxID=556533 RepID=A0ABY5H5U1_9PSED|nr:Ig-like domain-containing protein [Pseudomonas benzenivorans]UTW07207.1 Ig-like domain-containing protein [Pseudomonas benzenivorans]